MRKKIKSIWLSICKASSGITSTQRQPPALECLTGKLYDSISTLTLDRFIRCSIAGELNLLKINSSDVIPAKILIQTWEAIHEAFLDGMKDSEGLHKLRLLGKINNLEFTYRLIHMCVKYLSIAHDMDVIDILKKHCRMAGAFNPEDQDSYFRDLQVVLNRAQGMLIEIENKKSEYAVLEGKEKIGQQTTQRHFDQLIAQVSIYTKFHIDKKIITVSEFIEYYTSRRESYEALEEQYEKSKR